MLVIILNVAPLSGTLNGVVWAQTVGRISGTVTDGSGAVIHGAKVTITNQATGVSRTGTTDDSGFFVVTNLAVGDYSITVEQDGFKKATKTGYELVSDGRLTANFQLDPGAISDTVTVTASTGETINTTSGEMARVVDQNQVQDLALNGRNYMQLTTLIPGVPLLVDDQLGMMTSLSVNQPINGNRGNANLLAVDGGFNLDSGSNNSQINNVGIDFIREVKIQTSNFSAEYGRNSGASINIVTRSGSNRFHGSAFEFLRNDKFDANSFFNNAAGRFTDNPNALAPDVKVPSGDSRVGKAIVDRPPLRYNNFGFSFGGPIIKDKLFFFGGIEWKKIRRFTGTARRTLPTRAERAGDFSLRTGTLNLPGTTTPVPGRNLASMITPDGRAFANVYNEMEKLAVAYIDTPTANNAIYQRPNPFDFRQELVRIDYTVNSKHSIYGRYLHDDYDLIDPFGVFIGADLPTIPNNRLRPGFSYQIGHTWLLKPTLINEVKINASWNSQRIFPVGEFWKRDTYGFTFPQLFLAGGRFENGIPSVTITNFASYEGASRSLLSPTTDIAIGDNITNVRGKHSLKAGVLIIRNRKDQNARSQYSGQVAFSTGGNTKTTGNAFADALLGNFRTYSEASADPIGFFRFKQYDAYVTDSWKLHPKLSLELGARYQYAFPIYTQANNVVNFDPSLYDPSKAVTILANGTIDTTKGGNRFNGLVRPGNGVPEKELGRVPTANSPDVAAVPTGAPRGFYEPQHLISPRLGFAWSPLADGKMAVRGGFGIFYDRIEGNLIFPLLSTPPFLSNVQLENGNISNPAGGRPAAAAPFGALTAIDPNLVLPYTMNWSLSVQRELPGNVFAEMAWVAGQGRHLLRQPDINQPTFAVLLANSKLPTAQRLNVNALRPYKGYSAINMRLSDGTSSYNALQLYAAKRKGDVTMTVSYTWSKILTDTSGNFDGFDVGENPFNRRAERGPADFDRTHIFVTTYTYRVPFFRNWKSVQGAVLSGWELSGITRVQTGQPLTVRGTTSIGNRRGDYLGGVVSLPSVLKGPDSWFNTNAFFIAPDERTGTSGVGIVEGPGRYLWDLSMRKKFAIREGMRLQLQADFFNAFNQTNFNNPGTTLGSVTTINGVQTYSNRAFGTVTGAAPGRNVQLGLKLTF
jgi:hypothetical protein